MGWIKRTIDWGSKIVDHLDEIMQAVIASVMILREVPDYLKGIHDTLTEIREHSRAELEAATQLKREARNAEERARRLVQSALSGEGFSGEEGPDGEDDERQMRLWEEGGNPSPVDGQSDPVEGESEDAFLRRYRQNNPPPPGF